MGLHCSALNQRTQILDFPVLSKVWLLGSKCNGDYFKLKAILDILE